MKCKICNYNTREIVHEKFQISYFQCLNCDFIFKGDKHLISHQDELDIYNRHNNSIDDPRYVAYFKDFIDKAIVPYVAKDAKTLDFGSGPSPVLAMILERDYGFKDIDIYDLFYAPSQDYENKKYDLIVSTEVIEHLKNPLDYFFKFKELLNDQGVLSIMTLFHPNDDLKFKSWHYVGDKSHIGFYNTKSMGKIAELVGLDIVYNDNRRYVSFKT